MDWLTDMLTGWWNGCMAGCVAIWFVCGMNNLFVGDSLGGSLIRCVLSLLGG